MKKLLALLSLFFSLNASAQLRVAIIDTGLNLDDPRFSSLICASRNFTNEGMEDNNGHGTHVAGLIKKYAGNSSYCLIILKYYTDKQPGFQNTSNFIKALQAAVDLKADIINYSGGGEAFDEKEYLIIKNHIDIAFVVAAGNEGQNLDHFLYYPARLRSILFNIRVVGALDDQNKRADFSNFGRVVTDWEPGVGILSTVPCKREVCMEYKSGTSMSTAIKTGKLIKELNNVYH